MVRTFRVAVWGGLLLAHVCNIFAAEVDAARIVGAADNSADWLTHGRTYDEQRFSPLARIHQGNVSDLALAWYFDLDTTRGQEATPLVIDGVMYVTSAWSKVFALDARTGRQLWHFDPKVDGEQYVAAFAGIGGVAVAGGLGGAKPRSPYGRVLAFKLGGKAQLPALLTTAVRRPPDVRRANAQGDIQLGGRNYDRVCRVCHGENARSVTAIPDLRYSNAIVDRDTFKAIVIDGARADKGMVGFGSTLSPEQAEEIRAYLVSLAAAL